LLKISEFFSRKKKKKKYIIALFWIMFKPLIRLKDTKTSRRIQNLAYKALKRFKRLPLRLVKHFSINELKIDLEQWLKKSDSYKSKHRIVARVDATKNGKKYAEKMPELAKLYDYVNKCYIKTHEIYIFLITIGRKHYIVDFCFVRRKKKFNKGCNDIAFRMIIDLLNDLWKYRSEFIHYCRLSLDGAWGNGTMLSEIKGLGFQYNALKSNGKDLVEYNGKVMRLKELEKLLSTEEGWKSFNPKHNLKGDYKSLEVKHVNEELSIKVVIRRFKSKKHYRYLMLLCTNEKLNDFQISQCYEGRWGIEESIKELKSDKICDLTRYSFHSQGITNIVMFIALRFTCYMILNWYQVKYCRPSKTSMWKVAKGFEEFFISIGYKQIWKLFSV
jgi:hypothetical protein